MKSKGIEQILKGLNYLKGTSVDKKSFEKLLCNVEKLKVLDGRIKAMEKMVMALPKAR